MATAIKLIDAASMVLLGTALLLIAVSVLYQCGALNHILAWLGQQRERGVELGQLRRMWGE